MGNLLRADFFRLWRSKSFWACMMFQVGTGAFVPVSCYLYELRHPIPYSQHLDAVFLNFIPFLCILSALFCALFIGTDYSDGSVRNKLVVGHRRWEIYFSHLVTCTVACLLMCVGYLLPYLAVGIPLFGFLQKDASTVLAYLGTTLVLTLALASVYTMLAMLIPNRAVSAVVALVLSFTLLISGSYLYSYLNYPPTYTQVTYNSVSGAAGINTIATLLVAFLRPTLAGLTCGRENAREGGIPSSGRLGERVFINYVVVLTLLHHAVFFLLEALSWEHVLHTVVRIVVSSVVTVAFVWIAARIFTAQFSARV